MKKEDVGLGIVTFVLLLAVLACSILPDQFATQVVDVGKTSVAVVQTEAPQLQTQFAQLAQTAVNQITAIPGSIGKKIGIDPGHGWGGDPGAVANGLQEKDVNLDIANRVKTLLEGKGYQTVMTRTGDDPHKITYAAQVINSENPVVTVSIHSNSAGMASGTEACYTVGKLTDADSLDLAKRLTNAISQKLSIRNIGVFPENYATKCSRKDTTGWNQLYIHDMNPPTALIETAFLSNPSDAKLLTERPQDFAEAIVNAIIEYLSKK